jgi:hypothetical protein
MSIKEKRNRIKEKLSKKTVSEINEIAKRVNYPLQGNKTERVHALAGFFVSKDEWDIIVNGKIK